MNYVAVVFRRVLPGCESEFEQAMDEFTQACRNLPGFEDMRLLQDHNQPGRYTVLNSFQDQASRRQFTASPFYADWMARLDRLSQGPPEILEHHGLSGFFPAPGGPAAPPRWKMALATWLVVWPWSAFLNHFLGPPISQLSLPVRSAIISSLITIGLAWLWMPMVTKLLRGWLFPQPTGPR